MKYLRHIEKGVLVPYNESIKSAEWEEYEEPEAQPAEAPAKRGRKKAAEAEQPADGDAVEAEQAAESDATAE